jgi:HEAT repeat protein
MNENEPPLDLATLDISEYSRFERHIENLREARFPYPKFVMMVLHLPRRRAVDFLRRATFHASSEVVCEAIDLLARLECIDACPRAIELLTHSDPRVRRVAVESLHRMQIRCETSILRLLQTETDGDTRHAAVRCLALIGTVQSLPTLHELRRSDLAVDYEGRPIGDVIERAIHAIEAREATDEQT